MAFFSIKVLAPVVFVVVSVVAQLQTAAFAGEGLTGGGEQREFDYFILTLLWPPTACRNTSLCCPTNGCCRGADSPTEFTIHGLWPQYNDNQWPSCCTDESFEENQIISLSEDLEKYWPTFQCGSTSTCHETNGSFWAHEYEKHGTCAAPVIKGEYDYFTTTLDLFLNHNVTKALEDAGIKASNTEKYPIDDVKAAVQVAFHASPRLTCVENGVIQELRLCFDKDFKTRECDLTESCPQLVRFPTYEPQESNMVEGAIPWMVDAEAIII